MESLVSEDVRRTLEHGNRIFGIKTDKPWRARRQCESAHSRPARAWFNADTTSAESLFWPDSGVVIARQSNHCATTTPAAVPPFHDRSLLSEQRGSFDLSLTANTPGTALLQATERDGRLHIFKTHRRRGRGI